MLIDVDLPPQQTVYYTAALVLSVLGGLPTARTDLATVLGAVGSKHSTVSVDAVVLALDYLFLLGLVDLTEEGGLHVSEQA